MNRKYILITGATAGFGEACARLFASEGWSLLLTGRRKDRLDALKAELKTENIDIQTLCFDIRNEHECIKAVQSLANDTKLKIEILLNNAGLAVGRSSLEEGSTDDWERMIDTNIKGLLYMSKQVIPILKSNGKGHIVNLGSIAGKEVYAGGNVYSASKHAVDSLSRSMRIDLLPFNIKVTNIAPGAAETEFSIVRFKGDKDKAASVYDGYQALFAEDVADSIFYVCSRPSHVCINDLVIMPTAQANATNFHKS